MTAPTEAPTVDAFYDQELEALTWDENEAKCDWDACSASAEVATITPVCREMNCQPHADESRRVTNAMPRHELVVCSDHDPTHSRPFLPAEVRWVAI